MLAYSVLLHALFFYLICHFCCNNVNFPTMGLIKDLWIIPVTAYIDRYDCALSELCKMLITNPTKIQLLGQYQISATVDFFFLYPQWLKKKRNPISYCGCTIHFPYWKWILQYRFAILILHFHFLYQFISALISHKDMIYMTIL